MEQGRWISEPAGQVPDPEGGEPGVEGVLPQDEGRLLQIPGGGGDGRRQDGRARGLAEGLPG